MHQNLVVEVNYLLSEDSSRPILAHFETQLKMISVLSKQLNSQEKQSIIFFKERLKSRHSKYNICNVNIQLKISMKAKNKNM